MTRDIGSFPKQEMRILWQQLLTKRLRTWS